MPLFSYKARDAAGAVVNGEIEGSNAKSVKMQLAEKGYLPINVSTKGVDVKLPDFLSFKKKVKVKELMAFTRQFATLFRAGVPMDRIFATLSRQIENKDFKNALIEIRNDVASGSTLMTAFGKHPNIFGELYVNMLNVGEQGGTLDEALTSLTDILEKDFNITSKIKSATLYPKIVMVVFLGVFILMMTFVVPRFGTFYSGFGAELPLPTRIMMGVSKAFVSYWYLLIIGVVIIFIGIKKYGATEKGRFRFDRWRFKFPVFGKLDLLVANARFGHLVSEMYRSGVPLVKSLSVVSNAIGNKAYKKELDTASEEIEHGSSLASALEGKKYFTSIIIESVAVGEQSGSLDDMLEVTARFYDDEVQSMLNKLTTLIEPLLLIGLFGMVLMLALGVFLPMWRISSVVLEGN